MSAPWDILAPKFERLVESGSCPPPGEMLLAVAAEFRPVDATAVSFRLDECARTLFDAAAARDGGTASHRLAAPLTDELRCRTDESTVEGLWLDRVLDRRAGHPLALAVLAAEIGRRAGIAVGVCSTPTGWYAAIGEPERLWLIDPALDPGPTPAGPVRRHCGHEVAFAALTGVYARLIRDGDGAGACRAAQLRGRLPVGRHDRGRRRRGRTAARPASTAAWANCGWVRRLGRRRRWPDLAETRHWRFLVAMRSKLATASGRAAENPPVADKPRYARTIRHGDRARDVAQPVLVADRVLPLREPPRRPAH